MWIRQCASLKSVLFLSLLILSFFPQRILAADAIERVKSASFESVVLNIILNEEQKGEMFVKITEDGDFLIKVDDLKNIGFIRPDGVTMEIGGEPYISIKSMQQVESIFNEKDLSLIITAAPELLPKSTIDLLSQRQLNVYYPTGNSAFLNYRLNYNDSDSTGGVSNITNQLGIRLKDVLFLSDSSYTKTENDERLVRLMSNMTYDRRDDMQRIVAGDLFASSGELGSSLNIGGIGFSKVYRINPYFAKNPMLTLSGLISLPSEVEIYLNGVSIKKEKLSPGEFELKNISYYGGAGLVEVVIRDSFGREQRIKYPYYFTDLLLKKGLHEYSYNIGVLRERFGAESNSYGDRVFSAFHRYGVRDLLTVGGRAEGTTKGLYNLGPQLAYNIYNSGVVTLSLAASKDDADKSGFGWSLDYGYQGGRLSTRFMTRNFTEDYTTISSNLSTEKTKGEYAAGVGYGTASSGNISVDFFTTIKYVGTDKQATTVGYSRNLSKLLSGYITYRNVREQEAYNEFFVGLNYYSDGDLMITSNYRSSKDDKTAQVQAQKSLPVGEGMGYRATIERTDNAEGANYKFNPLLQYSTRYGLYEGEFRENYYETGNRSESYQLSASGAIVYVGRTFGLIRPVTDSFGMVEVGDIKGIRVYQGGLEVGKTDSSGKVFVPNLSSYFDNSISIEDKDITLDYMIPEVRKYVSPPFRSGAYINFDVSRFQAVTGKLHIKSDKEMKDVEFYEIRLLVGEKDITFPTGKGGEFYIENIRAGQYQARFDYKDKACLFSISVPESDETIIDIGDVVCEDIQ